MRKLALFAGLAALTMSMPAVADPGGHAAKGKAHVKAKAHVNGKAHVKGKAGHKATAHRHSTRGSRYARATCPPGLVKKNNGCLPPGLAKKTYTSGDRLPAAYGSYTDYNSLPEAYRTQFPNQDQYRYVYRDDRVYVVDPTTRLVTRVLETLR